MFIFNSLLKREMSGQKHPRNSNLDTFI
jgi:ABC-type multidrug transport system ATPase subunit